MPYASINSALFLRARAVVCFAILPSALLALAAPTQTHAAEPARQQLESAGSAASIVGAAIRRRGHLCMGPVAADPVAETATAHRKQWRLTCGTENYRVTFVLDRMVNIERLE